MHPSNCLFERMIARQPAKRRWQRQISSIRLMIERRLFVKLVEWQMRTCNCSRIDKMSGGGLCAG